MASRFEKLLTDVEVNAVLVTHLEFTESDREKIAETAIKLLASSSSSCPTGEKGFESVTRHGSSAWADGLHQTSIEGRSRARGSSPSGTLTPTLSQWEREMSSDPRRTATAAETGAR